MSIHRAFCRAWLVAALASAWVMPAAGQGGPGGEVPADSGETLPNTAGRGLALGRTGLTLGGYATGEAEDLEGSDYYSELEGNLFVLYEPVRQVTWFTDLEFESDAVAFERSYLDFSQSDALKLRLGKFLTPIGRWNQAHIEPLTWTTSEPLMIETVFDDTVSGVSLQGSVFPSGGALSYALYASLVDPIEVDAEENFAEDSAGVRLEWASLGGWTAGLSHYASKPVADSRWHHLGGADLLWQAHRRVEVSAEALAGEGSRSRGAVQAGYVQAAVETWRSLYLVGRYEALSLPGLPTARFVTTGLVWAPMPSVRIKADYTFANEAGADGEPGARASLSYLF